MTTVVAWTLAAALIGGVIAAVGNLSDARAESAGRDARDTSSPLTSIGLLLFVLALAGLGAVWLVAGR